MTVLSACIDASIELNQPEPASLFSTSDQFAKELRMQANKAAVAIAKVYDWQALHTLQTLTGDGSTTSFALPSNYARMVAGADLLTSSSGCKLSKASDVNEWLNFQINPPAAGTPGKWIILGGAMQVRPAIASGDTVKFYYIKNTIVTGASAAAQAAFLADGDTFNLPERLLTLSVIWRWRAQKRRDYAEDMKNYEVALAEETATDKGSRVLVVGRQRHSIGVEVAHPAIVV